MRPIRTLAPLALGLVALAVAGCQRPSEPTTTPAPTPTTVEPTIPTNPTRPATPPTPGQPAPPPHPPPPRHAAHPGSQAHPGPGVGDHRRALAGQDPCPGPRA